MVEARTETFQTEVKELLQLIIHSLYSHPEIFLRELISNASDAIDKLKLEALTNGALMQDGFEPTIAIDVDSDARTLTISDNGIGMSEAEVLQYLGTIAHSGTKQFLAKRKEIEENPSLIGQFGVGFYSAFMVADKVVVTSRRAGENSAVRWESDGQGQFHIEPADKDAAGTSVKLFLKPVDSAEEGSLPDFTEEWTLRDVVKKHSDFIAYPITMEIERNKPVSEDEPEKTELVKETATLNSQKALWLKAPEEISDEEYKEFYSHLTHDYQAPLSRIHFRAEGTQEFTSLLFIPGIRPWNYDYDGFEVGLSLYVQRVLIKSHCEELIPAYLRFVKGIVDSADLSLNVSREMLQQDRQVAQIRKSLTGKIMRWLKDNLKDSREDYEKFWGCFGATLKEGLVREPQQKDKLLPLFLFKSNKQDELCTVDEYIDRMAEGQPAIYFIVSDTIEHARRSPYLEQLTEKGYEVLLLTDPIDEFLSDKFGKYKDFEFQSITVADLKLDDDDTKEQKEEARKKAAEEYASLMSCMQGQLAEEIKEVRISSRLKNTPVCLVDEMANAGYMDQLYRQMGQEPPKVKRILEINPDHALVKAMAGCTEEVQKDWASLLYQQALLNEGSSLQDPLAFTSAMTELMMKTISQ
jgi:molecular chaperone HtpG